jgi:PmbA protein
MLGQEKSFNIMEKALSFSKSDQMELVLMGHDHFLTRYANSEIHQNTDEEDAILFVKSVIGKKIGASSVNHFDDDAIKSAVKLAEEAASKQVELEDFSGLPEPQEVSEVKSYFPRTAQISPEEKALIIHDMISRAHGERISLSGAFYTGESELAVMNTNGVRNYFNETRVNLAVVASGENTSGYASFSDRDVDKVDHVHLIEEALESTKTYNNIITLDPGEYPLILEEYAVADMIEHLESLAFSSKSVEEKTSFIDSCRGVQLFPDEVSIYDDALHPATLSMPFDYEGGAKQRVGFVKKGVVTGDVTYNKFQAGKFGVNSTGHGLPPFTSPSATSAMHISMEPGGYSDEDIIRQMGTGLYVKRFHYLTAVHPLKTIVSGMTRDGVFWVENGEKVARVTNMRFTQSIIKMLSNVKAVSKDRKLIWFREYSVDFPVSILAPKLYVEKFNFTGQTEF